MAIITRKVCKEVFSAYIIIEGVKKMGGIGKTPAEAFMKALKRAGDMNVTLN